MRCYILVLAVIVSLLAMVDAASASGVADRDNKRELRAEEVSGSGANKTSVGKANFGSVLIAILETIAESEKIKKAERLQN